MLHFGEKKCWKLWQIWLRVWCLVQCICGMWLKILTVGNSIPFDKAQQKRLSSSENIVSLCPHNKWEAEQTTKSIRTKSSMSELISKKTPQTINSLPILSNSHSIVAKSRWPRIAQMSSLEPPIFAAMRPLTFASAIPTSATITTFTWWSRGLKIVKVAKTVS